jgi:hypothetical protein
MILRRIITTPENSFYSPGRKDNMIELIPHRRNEMAVFVV